MAGRAKKNVQYLNGRNAAKYSTGGSAAYEVGYAADAGARVRNGTVVRPRTVQREQVLARPRARVREKGEVSLFSIVGVVAIAVVAVMLLVSYAQLLTVSDSVVSLRDDLSDLQTEQARLLTEYELSIDLQSIEAAVTANGQMVKPQSEQIIYIDTYEEDGVTFYADESAVQGAKGVLDSLGEIWSNITSYFQ